jgi:glycosyltransferase involved in cell wall biosynthesis
MGQHVSSNFQAPKMLSQKTVAVVILTLNEQDNISQALESVVDWANEIVVLDSFSADRTVQIAELYNCQIWQHKFENYSKQRNYAIEQIPIKSEWILFLDADEWMPNELKLEISQRLANDPEENGFFIKWRFIWMGKWIRRGYYPTWMLRLFRHAYARCDERAVNERLIVKGDVGYLENDFIHEDRKHISEWIAKHNRYASLEALDLINTERQANQQHTPARFLGNQAERKRWLRYRVWNRLPPLGRPILYFIYRYFLRGGFLDGHPAFIYHFLHALWYPMLIDIKYLEYKKIYDNKNNKISRTRRN